MAVSQILPFAAAGGANVVDQASYAASSSVATGFQAGTASSAYANKALRQATLMAAALSQFVVQQAGVDSLDDGNVQNQVDGIVGGVQAITSNGLAWNSTVTYAINAIVTRNGGIYVAINSNTNSIPPSANWRFFGGGLLSLSVAGAVPVTLTANQSQFNLFQFTGAITANINVLFTTTAPSTFVVQNATTGAFTLTLGIQGSGGATYTIPQGCTQEFYQEGTNIYPVSLAVDLTGAVNFNGKVVAMSNALNEFQGANLASAATVNLGAATGNLVTITGTTTITAFDTVQAGTARTVIYSGSLTMTNSSNIQLPGNANIVTQIGDVASYRSLGAGQWKCTGYLRAAGGPVTPIGMQSSFKNLVISASGISSNISLTADEATLEDTTGAQYTFRAINLTIASSGSGANGLDTGALAGTTWYSVWVIFNPTTQTVAGLTSLSTTAPTMPSGYTAKARLGWIRTDGTANKFPLSFKQQGRQWEYVVTAATNVTTYPAMASGNAAVGTYNNSTYTPATLSVAGFVAPTASAIRFQANMAPSSQGGMLGVSNTSVGGGAGTQLPPPVSLCVSSTAVAGAGGYSVVQTFGLFSTNIFYAVGAPGGSGFGYGINAIGYEDNI